MRLPKSVFLLFSLVCVVCRAGEPSDSIGGRSRQWLADVTGAAMGLAVNASATELLKHTVSESRPDRSDNRSFPSRHTSYAFTLASIGAHELYSCSPLWVLASHAAADAVAMQRVCAFRHYPGDVLAGAALGLLSAELGYGLSRLIFPSPHRRATLSPMHNASGLSVSTTALIPLRSHSHGSAVGCGVESSLRGTLALGRSFGAGATLGLRSQPVYADVFLSGFLNGASMTLDAYMSWTDGFWQADSRVAAGVLRYFDRPCDDITSWSPLVGLTAGIRRRVAKALSVGGRLGCDFADMPGSCFVLSLSLVTKAEF